MCDAVARKVFSEGIPDMMHGRDDAVRPFGDCRLVAVRIRNARFVALDGRTRLIGEHDPGWPRFQEGMQAFLASYRNWI
jgi:hypothetical protein